MNKPLISVIIPVYNVAKYLPRCLDSVIGQTYNNLEIILVDDGSTDNSLEICNQYAKQDKRIVVIHQENGGLSAARNSGMDHMHGEFFTFIDSDDWVTPDYCQTLWELLEQTNADFSWGGFTTVSSEGSFCTTQEAFNWLSPKNKTLSLDEIVCLSIALNEHAAWAKLFCTKRFGHLRFNGFYAQSEDLDFFIQILQFNAKIAYSSKIIYFYNRQNPHAITASFCFIHQEKILNQYDILRDLCIKNHCFRALEELNDFVTCFYCLFVTQTILKGNNKDIQLFFSKHKNELALRRKDFLRNSRIQFPGKIFMLGVSFFPKTACFVCRLPLLNNLLSFLFKKRVSS